MTSPRIFEFNLQSEIERLFHDASVVGNPPKAVILMGGVATGKTTLRKQQYSSGYVVIDAGEIFLNLSRGEFLPFPGPLEPAMEAVGRGVTVRALSKRHNIVTEIIGGDQQLVHQLITSLQNLGYRVQIAQLTCSPEEAVNRNLTRRLEESISAHYSEPFHSRWIFETSAELCAKPACGGLRARGDDSTAGGDR
jgi:hypothetical protein